MSIPEVFLCEPLKFDLQGLSLVILQNLSDRVIQVYNVPGISSILSNSIADQRALFTSDVETPQLVNLVSHFLQILAGERFKLLKKLCFTHALKDNETTNPRQKQNARNA